jgi:hypothetical protein
MKIRCLVFLWSVVVLFGIGLRAQSLNVLDEKGHSSSVTAAQIARLPRIAVEVNDHGVPAKFEGIPLSAVLAAAGVPLGDTLRGPRLAEGLLIEAGDGYKVLFALAEVDPAFAARQIIVADTRDGKSLDAKEGPFRIVAPEIGGRRAGFDRSRP